MRKLLLVLLSILTFAFSLFTCIKVFMVYSKIDESKIGYEINWNRDTMKRLHKFHGTNYSYYDRGKWYFIRNGKKCELWDPKKRNRKEF